MALITLITDFGLNSHFNAAVKGAILKRNINHVMVDLCHNIEPFDRVQTAFFIRNSVFEFPKNTIHLVGVDSHINQSNGIVVAHYQNQYIILANNGILSIVLEQLDFDYQIITPPVLSFFNFKNEFIDVMDNLILCNFDLNKLDYISDQKLIKTSIQKPHISTKEIIGEIIFIDSFNNAYSNIKKSEFDAFVKNEAFEIKLSTHFNIDKIETEYNNIKEGEPIALFDENEYLHFGIFKGKATQLIGFYIGSKIKIFKK